MTIFIFTIQGEILQQIPKTLNYFSYLTENECLNIELKENQYFYFDINDVFYRYANDFQGLLSDRWNLTFIDKIYQDQLAPNFIQIFSTQYLEIDNKNYICFLFQDSENYNYILKCKQGKQSKYIDNEPQFNQKYEFSFTINYEEGLLCKNYLLIQKKFFIFCLTYDQMVIHTFDLIDNKQSYYYYENITNTQCSSKVFIVLETFILIGFYKCKNWEILFLNFDLEIKRRITQKDVIQEGEIDSQMYLQNIQYCYTSLFLNFDQVQIKIITNSLLITYSQFVEYLINYQQVLVKILLCKQYHEFVSEEILNTFISDIEKQDLQEVMTVGSSIFLFQYSNHIIAKVTNGISQTINIEINSLFQYKKDHNTFLIVDKQNVGYLFQGNLFYNHLLYQKQGKYLGFYKIKDLQDILVQCYNIIEYSDKNDKLNDIIQQLKKQNYLLQINNKFNQILIDKLNFQYNRHINISFYFPNVLNQIQNIKIIRSKQFQIFGQFFIFQIKTQIYIIFNQKDQLVSIYNFNSSRINNLNLRINFNEIKTCYEIQKTKFVLVQEEVGKIYIFKQLEYQQDIITYQIFQFKEQIRISFLILNVLCLQLMNSSEILFQNLNSQTLQNSSLHHPHNLEQNNFYENVNDAIKVINFNNIFIFQYEYYLLIQIGFSDTLTINQRLLILGGYIKTKNSAKFMLLAMNNEMNSIHKYLITQQQFYLLSTYIFSDYIPISPLCYQVLDNQFIIITQKQEKDLYYILLFNLDQQINFEQYDIISTPYQYFYAFSDILYYYNQDKELIQYNMQYFTIDFDPQQLKYVIYQGQFEVDIRDKYEINSNVYSEKLDLQIINQQQELQLINQTNYKIIMKNNQAFLNPNTFFTGFLLEFDLKNTTLFHLQTPFLFVSQKQCYNLINNFCIIQCTPIFIIQDLSNNFEQNITIPILYNQDADVYSCNGILIIVYQFEQNVIKISYFKQDISSFILIEDVLESSQVISQILLVQSNLYNYYYFINDSITLLSSQKIDKQVQDYLFHQINHEKICQILGDKNSINITCFKIQQGIINTFQNYTIPFIEIYNAIDYGYYLKNFIQNTKFHFLDLSQTLQEELNIKLIICYKQNLLFYIHIIQNDQQYQIKLNNIIRIPSFNYLCKYFLIHNKLICDCLSFYLFLFELDQEFQVLSPYAVLPLIKVSFTLLNNTHIAISNIENQIVQIYIIDKWRLIKNENISINNEENVTFQVGNHLNKLEFIINVVNQIEEENYFRFIKYVILVINNISIQIFIIVFKQQKRR